jgi:hypothetical protein
MARTGTADRATAAQPAAAPLDLHEGISDAGSRRPDPAAGGCLRWPESLRLLNRSTGELVRGRCRATNLCGYCARLAAVETSEMLALDALEGAAPAVWCVLTTRDAEPDPRAFYTARRQVWRAVRRRWPDAEYAAVVEFTTGYGPRAAGARRPHWNLLVKGVPAGDVDELRDVVERVWCSRVDAEPWAQFTGHVGEVGGLMRYLALHFLKESQAPPIGWRGHRFMSSRGYLARPASAMRAEARRALRLKRAVWRLVRDGVADDQAGELAELELQVLEAQAWELRRVRLPSAVGSGCDGTPGDGRRPGLGDGQAAPRDRAGTAAGGLVVARAGRRAADRPSTGRAGGPAEPGERGHVGLAAPPRNLGPPSEHGPPRSASA